MAPTAVDYMEGGSILDDMKPAAKLETNVQTVKKSGANQEEEITQNVNYNTQPHRLVYYFIIYYAVRIMPE